MRMNNKIKMSAMATSSSDVNVEMPQWKKDLIARLRNQNKRQQQQLYGTGPPQSPPPATPVIVAPVRSTSQQPKREATVVSGGVCELGVVGSSGANERCNNTITAQIVPLKHKNQSKMVQERVWQDTTHEVGDYKNGKNSDSDSSEDLHYGPGIVSKLKNKYLSLALRESSARASILPMRKAASLENILDEETVPNNTNNRLFQSNLNGKNDKPNRYRNTIRGSDLKRARSVETISRVEENFNEQPQRPKSLNIDMLIKKPLLPTSLSGYEYTRINRPKRITPIMNEKEKPPVDVVKQAKLIFERRPEQRTKPPQHTGEVAAKVATYKSIIVQAKHHAKLTKPPIKHKPDKLKKREDVVVDIPKAKQYNLPSPIPDISRIDSEDKDRSNGSLSETPDLILTSSPLSAVASPNFRISATENFIKEEIRHSAISPIGKPVSAQSINNINQASSTITFNFVKLANKNQDHLPAQYEETRISSPSKEQQQQQQHSLPPQHSPTTTIVNEVHSLESPKLALLQPLKLDLNNGIEPISEPPYNTKILSPRPLTILEIEKNLINTAKTLEQPKLATPNNKPNLLMKINSVEKIEVINKIQVPKKRTSPKREPESSNSIVFNFSDRQDVPDYVHNDGVMRMAKIEKPKVGEGGIILLPGASIDESFTDEEEELLRSLEAPPSPCDVTFINDNILIDGKSSLSQKTKRTKMKISFVEACPEIYEYPSESSLLIEETTTTTVNAQLGHTVPSLSGSSLANYTPKSTEDFQPGVSRSVHEGIPLSAVKPQATVETINELVLQEIESPILFSAGTNTDILF